MKSGWLTLATLAGALTALGETLTLTPVADAAMLSLNPDNNYGKLLTLPAGQINKPGEVARAFFRFDVSAIPAGSIITNVTLQFRVSKEAIGGPADTVALHRLLVDWAEGAKATGNHGTDASPGESNWIWRQRDINRWAAPGGLAGTDFAAAASATLTWNQPATYTFQSTAGLIADVQAWVDAPASNQGWLLKSDTESVEAGAKRVVSREGTAAQRPQLVIGYKAGPPPTDTPKIDSMSLAGNAAQLKYRIEAGNLYELRAFGDMGGPAFQVLTNYASKFESFDETFTDPLSEDRRFYMLTITGQID